MTEIIMPKMGDGMEEGTLLEWIKKDGDWVESGEVIGSIQTDKATLELESPSAGILAGLLISPGETVPVGVPIAAILNRSESLPELWGSRSSKTLNAKEEAPNHSIPGISMSSDKSFKSPEIHDSLIQSIQTSSQKRVKASPLAKKIAKEKGVDLLQISGSGPGGRIVKKDIRLFLASQKEGSLESTVLTEPVSVPLNRIRQITAERTQHSKQTVPHFYITLEVDLEKILALREWFAQEESGQISLNDFVLKASARALREMPEVNATYHNKEIRIHKQVNIGIAVAIADGLMVPVIQNADQLSLRELSSKSKELAKKAREMKLVPSEMSGCTFSISNMGMFGVDHFVAIINEPNAAILAISSAQKKVVVGDKDEPEIRTRMNMTGSFDHRVLDGVVGARFMNLIKGYLENPTRLIE